MTDIINPRPGDIKLPDGRFAPGNPGKPRGAKGKGLALVKRTIEKALSETVGEGDEAQTKLEKAVEAQVNNAVNGDLAAFLAIMAYFVGKPKQIRPDDDKDMETAMKGLIEWVRTQETADFRPQADMVGKNHQENGSDDGG